MHLPLVPSHCIMNTSPNHYVDNRLNTLLSSVHLSITILPPSFKQYNSFCTEMKSHQSQANSGNLIIELCSSVMYSQINFTSTHTELLKENSLRLCTALFFKWLGLKG